MAALEAEGAKPQVFGVPTITDGIGMGTEAMKYSLVSREVIADCIETSVNGQAMDGVLVCGGCDKNMPGGMMAIARMNVPAIYVYAGTIKPGKWKGQDLTIVSAFEAVGAYAAGKMSKDDFVGIEKNAKFEVLGGLIPNHRLTVFDKHHKQLVDPRVRQAITHAIDRQAIVDSLWAGRTRVPPGLQWEFYDKMFIEGWTVPAFDPAKARELLRAANYKGDPIPFRVLNNYYTNQVGTAQILVEMWRSVGLNIQIEMRENWQQIFENNGQRAIRDWSNSAGFSDPISSIVGQHGPQGQQQQSQEWTNVEMNTLSGAMETEFDLVKRKAMFKRMLEICERDDPAFTVLHQTATFTAKRKDIVWKAAPAFQMDFRAGNFRTA
jgi:ABC-type transport system substrate-binding protein